MEKRYLPMRMGLCEGKFPVKVKIAHFRLPSASLKRDCLSSLFLDHRRRQNVVLKNNTVARKPIAECLSNVLIAF